MANTKDISQTLLLLLKNQNQGNPQLGRDSFKLHQKEQDDFYLEVYEKEKFLSTQELHRWKKSLFSVYVGKLPVDVTVRELTQVVSEVAFPKDVFIVPPEGKQTYTYAFLRFGTLVEAQKVVSSLNGRILGNKHLLVELSSETRSSLSEKEGREDICSANDRLLRNRYPTFHRRSLPDSEVDCVSSKLIQSVTKLKSANASVNLPNDSEGLVDNGPSFLYKLEEILMKVKKEVPGETITTSTSDEGPDCTICSLNLNNTSPLRETPKLREISCQDIRFNSGEGPTSQSNESSVAEQVCSGSTIEAVTEVVAQTPLKPEDNRTSTLSNGNSPANESHESYGRAAHGSPINENINCDEEDGKGRRCGVEDKSRNVSSKIPHVGGTTQTQIPQAIGTKPCPPNFSNMKKENREEVEDFSPSKAELILKNIRKSKSMSPESRHPQVQSQDKFTPAVFMQHQHHQHIPYVPYGAQVPSMPLHLYGRGGHPSHDNWNLQLNQQQQAIVTLQRLQSLRFPFWNPLLASYPNRNQFINPLLFNTFHHGLCMEQPTSQQKSLENIGRHKKDNSLGNENECLIKNAPFKNPEEGLKGSNEAVLRGQCKGGSTGDSITLGMEKSQGGSVELKEDRAKDPLLTVSSKLIKKLSDPLVNEEGLEEGVELQSQSKVEQQEQDQKNVKSHLHPKARMEEEEPEQRQERQPVLERGKSNLHQETCLENVEPKLCQQPSLEYHQQQHSLIGQEPLYLQRETDHEQSQMNEQQERQPLQEGQLLPKHHFLQELKLKLGEILKKNEDLHSKLPEHYKDKRTTGMYPDTDMNRLEELIHRKEVEYQREIEITAARNAEHELLYEREKLSAAFDANLQQELDMELEIEVLKNEIKLAEMANHLLVFYGKRNDIQ